VNDALAERLTSQKSNERGWCSFQAFDHSSW
jgi:hypothetical protein